MNDDNPDEIAEFERLFADLPPVEGLDGTQRAILDALPVGREIYWRDEVLSAPLPAHLQGLKLDDVERVYGLTLQDRVRVINAGIPAEALLGVLKEIGPSRMPDMLTALGMDIEAVCRGASSGQALDADGSEKALGLVRLMGHMRRCGFAAMTFNDYGRWLVTWHPALNLAPMDYIGSATGLAFLEHVFAGG